MNWSKGYSASFQLSIVDPVTWRSTETFEVVSGSVSKSLGNTLVEAASVVLGRKIPTGETWIRLHLNAVQARQAAGASVFTGLASVPERNWSGRRLSNSLECYSVLKPAQDILLPRGYYVPTGIDGAAAAARLLSVGAAPVEHDDGAQHLSNSIVAEDGETNLSMARKIVSAIGWRIRIRGDGRIRVCPAASNIGFTYNSLENDAIESDITDTFDWFSCPNVFRAVADSLTAVARDDDEKSPYSTISRGREIWMEETNCNLGNGETIAQYAYRRLKEEQSTGRHISYVRRFNPDLVPGDLVRISHPAQEIDGTFQISSQRIDLGYMARTTEEADAHD